MSFIENLETLCKNNNTTISKMLLDIGLSKGLVSNWKSRGTTPNGEILVKIAKYFEVSVDYLLGTQDITVGAKQAQILALTTQLTEDEQNEVIKYAELLKRGRERKE